MTIAIRCEGVSKLYRLGAIGTGTLAHDLNRWWHQIRGKADPYGKLGQINERERVNSEIAPGQRKSEYVWALRNVSLDIVQGQVVGIIGRNGAGKSTLLKLLSRITTPTSGEIKRRGRLASLLEVGTGFHPELTGRENVFLNGLILGMKRWEVNRHLEEIVDFSGCAKYLDTPVKRYSSGMMVRLGFAVAAHLQCNTMIIDEVLAVGDADFQKKCIGKMRNMHHEGRTVLVVSHQLSMITAICDRGIVMQTGEISFDGPVADAVLHYQTRGGTRDAAIFDVADTSESSGDDLCRLRRAWTEDQAGRTRRTFDLSESFIVKMEFDLLKDESPRPYANYHFFDSRGEHAFVVSSDRFDLHSGTGRYVAACVVPAHLLNTGNYSIGVAATSMARGANVCFFVRDALSIQITEDLSQTLHTTRHGYAGAIPGLIRPIFDWQITHSLA